jgi:uncharacterized membrane protein
MRPATTRLLAIFCFFCLLGALSCEKDTPKSDTIVRGVVLDAETLQPLAGVGIVYRKVVGQGKIDPIHAPGVVVTNAEGRFEFNLGPLGGDIETVDKSPKYLTLAQINMPVSVQDNVVNDLVILMRPQNSILKVIVRNKYGLKDKIYVVVTDDIMESEYGKGQGRGLKKDPLVQNIGTEFVDSFYVFSNIYTKIKWRFEVGGSVPYMVDSL